MLMWYSFVTHVGVHVHCGFLSRGYFLTALEPIRDFANKDSMQLVKRCTKRDLKEFQKIALATHILPLVLLSWASLDTLSSSSTFQSTT